MPSCPTSPCHHRSCSICSATVVGEFSFSFLFFSFQIVRLAAAKFLNADDGEDDNDNGAVGGV